MSMLILIVLVLGLFGGIAFIFYWFIEGSERKHHK